MKIIWEHGMEVKTCYILIYFVVVAIIITFCEFISIPDLKISIFNIHCWVYYGIAEHLSGLMLECWSLCSGVSEKGHILVRDNYEI